jgi:hypothetical protein
LLFFFRRHDSTGPTDTTGAARKIFTPRHGGCGFHRERESFGTVSSRGLFVVVLAGLSLVPATTFGEPSIRVRGAARFEAGATSEGDLVVVAGALLDDIGRGVGGGSIAVGALSADGQEVRALARPCPGEPALVPHGQAKAGELSIKPGRDGRFCLVLATAGIASVVLRYADERGLIDPSTRRLGVEATRRSLALRFVDAPAVLELERDTQRLDVLARSDGPLLTPLPPVPLALFARAARADAHDVLVAEGATELGRPVSLTFPSDKLDEPGPVDLTLRFSGSDRLQPAETHLRLHATARVSLALSRTPTAGDPREGIEIDVALATPKGAVESGAVEAVLGGRTIGIANVERGSARVTVRFPRSGPMTRVELRYLPREPWWRAGPPLTVDVPVAPRGPWGSVGWLLLLGGIAFFLVQSWRRPRPAARAADPARTGKGAVASVVVVQKDQSLRAWRGSVHDAHGEGPIAGADIEVLEPGPERRVVARARANEEGAFELVPPIDPAGMLFSANAPFHSELVSPVPPFGVVRIALVTRRRHLLGRLTRWAQHKPSFGRARAEPTPGEVERHARRSRHEEVADWAHAVESAAFGPFPVDEQAERDVVRREPADPPVAPRRPP